MKRFWLTVSALGGAAFAAAGPSYIEGEVLVKFRPSAAPMSKLYHDQLGATQVSVIPQLGVERVKLPKGMKVETAVSYYKRLASVEYAEPNRKAQMDATPNDPMLGQQYSVNRMRVNQAWDLTTGSDSIIVAVLDTGVDYNHPDLAGKIIRGKDYADGDDDPMDEDGHGTHVAGIIAARTNNGVGVAGIGYNTRVLAIRVIGNDLDAFVSGVAQGIVYAADNGASVMNMSFGMYEYSKVWEDAVNYAWNKGVVIFATSGNDNITTRRYPGAYENSIAIGSTDRNDVKSDFSNWGADWVDIAGPGTDILSTYLGGSYEYLSGTSMASPNCAGVAALLFAYGGKGNVTNREVRQAIESTTVPVGSWLRYGRIDAMSALAAVVPPIVESRGPATATMFDGSTYNGTSQSLWTANDGRTFNVFSRLVSGLGGVAGAEMNYAYNYTASRWTGGKFTVRGSGKTGATRSVYLKRTNGQYDLIKSFPVSNSVVTTTLTLPTSITPYLSNRTLTFVVRDVLPTRYGTNTYSNSLDTAILESRTSSRVTP